MVSVFSQDNEREADIYGAWYAFQAGYDIERGAAVWERMAAVDENDPFLTTYFLASHPASLERMARLKLIAQYFKAGRAAEVFLQTADLNRRPPPPMPDALGGPVAGSAAPGVPRREWFPPCQRLKPPGTRRSPTSRRNRCLPGSQPDRGPGAGAP